MVAHPECPEAVLAMADFIGSTSAIIDWCAASDAAEFIVMTESGVRYSLEQLSPGKRFYFVANENCNCSECPYMRLNTLEKLRDCLAQSGAARGACRRDDAAGAAAARAHAGGEANGRNACSPIDRFFRPRARQPAHQRHGPLQHPLLLLHAGDRRAVRRRASEILDFEEIERFVRIAAGLGVNKLRVTGGEPLLRRDLPELIEAAGRHSGDSRSGADHQRRVAGEQCRAAVRGRAAADQRSLDTLDRERFPQDHAARRFGASAGRDRGGASAWDTRRSSSMRWR